MHLGPEQIRALLDPVEHGPPPTDRPRAATAAILTPGMELLFMRRSEHPGDPWSGHVSFPGGRVDPGDASLLAAAMRETLEEFGLELTGASCLGALSPLPARPRRVPDLVIHPFVFHLDHEPSLTPNEEVASIHRLSLADLLRGVGRGPMDYTWQGQQIQLPRVDFDGVRLWGLTLAQVDDLLHRVDGGSVGLARASG